MEAARQLQTARTKRGISTTQLGYRLGLDQSTIVRLEQSEMKGTISLNTLRKVANALGYRLEYTLVSNATDAPLTSSITEVRGRTPSKLSGQLRQDTADSSRSLSVAEKIVLSCQLSDLALKLRHV